MRSRYAGFRSWFCVLLVVHCTLSQGQDNKAEFAAKILTTLTSLPDCKLVYTFKQIGFDDVPTQVGGNPSRIWKYEYIKSGEKFSYRRFPVAKDGSIGEVDEIFTHNGHVFQRFQNTGILGVSRKKESLARELQTIQWRNPLYFPYYFLFERQVEFPVLNEEGFGLMERVLGEIAVAKVESDSFSVKTASSEYLYKFRDLNSFSLESIRGVKNGRSNILFEFGGPVGLGEIAMFPSSISAVYKDIKDPNAKPKGN